MSVEKATLFIITAPSGTGKTTLLKRLISELSNLSFSVSHTTRSPRDGEVDGADYFFTTISEFETYRDQGGFLEWAAVHGNNYGTSLSTVNKQLSAGIDIVLDIDVAGADQVRLKIPDAVSVFIAPPSIDDLRKRLYGRNLDSREVIEKRIRNARQEVKKAVEFDFLIINDDLEECYTNLKAIFLATRSQTKRSRKKIQRMIANCF